MLYTKFVRTNRSNTHERTNRTWHEYAREARALAQHTDACGHARDTHTHPAGLRTITHESVRHAQPQHTVTVVGHRSGRRSQATGRLSRFVISSAARSRRSQAPADTRIQHTNTNRTNTDTNRTGRITNRTGAGTNRTDTHTNRTGTGTRTQVAADSHSYSTVGSRSSWQSRADRHRSRDRHRYQHAARSREQEQDRSRGRQACGTGHRSRRGGHDTTRHGHDTIRYRYTATRYDTDTYDTIRSRTIHARRTRQAAGHAYDTHVNALRITYDTHDTHGTAPQHSTAGRPTHGTRLHAYAQ
jgi:hypothetical protein